MEGHARTWFTPKQRAELWERWKSGQCVADIARALERRNKSGVYRVLAINGGIAPLAVVAADRLDRKRQQQLLAQKILKFKTVAVVIAYLGFGLRDRDFVSSRVRANRAVQQVKIATDISRNRLQTPRATYFPPGVERSDDPDVLNLLAATFVLFQQFRPAIYLQRRCLAQIRA